MSKLSLVVDTRHPPYIISKRDKSYGREEGWEEFQHSSKAIYVEDSSLIGHNAMSISTWLLMLS